MSQKVTILDGRQIEEQLRSICHQILGKNPSLEGLALVGIRTGGAILAQRLAQMLTGLYGLDIPVGILDITLYRDDWSRIGPAPKVGKTEIPFDVDQKVIVLVDDVLFTGRTIRAAMDALMDMGRPKKIQVAVLVDRGERTRELPIVANHVGVVLDVPPGQRVNVYLKEMGYIDHVAIEEG
jgi:pyrimidine operon attenuation protein/uracil phosphoribosyltransferase